ncbi:MAG: hypothetical protein U9N57_01315 [Pseudomonadota bacterium]|nr:hypothetical protein [Pseudomonadota bacterium]
MNKIFTKNISDTLAKSYGLNTNYRLAEINNSIVQIDYSLEMVESILNKESTMFLDGAIQDELDHRQEQLIPPPNHCFLKFKAKGQPVIMVTSKTEEVDRMIIKAS